MSIVSDIMAASSLSSPEGITNRRERKEDQEEVVQEIINTLKKISQGKQAKYIAITLSRNTHIVE